MKQTNKELLGILFFGAIIAIIAAGWAVNLVKIFAMDSFSGELVARVIGAFIFPIGGILGFF